MPAHAQCAPDGSPVPLGDHIEDRYGDGLAGSALGGFTGAAAGALLGSGVAALFCGAGIGDGCDAAWIAGLGAIPALALSLGSMLGTELALGEDAGARVDVGVVPGVLLGGGFVAAGALLADETDEPAFIAIGFGMYALSVVFLTPLMALVFGGAPDCPVEM